MIIMAWSTMENGKKVSKMDMECGEVYLVIVTWDSGLRVKLMVMVFINGKTVIDMKDHGSNASSMEKVQIYSKTETCTQVITFKVNHLEKAYTNGKMEVSTVESLRTE